MHRRTIGWLGLSATVLLVISPFLKGATDGLFEESLDKKVPFAQDIHRRNREHRKTSDAPLIAQGYSPLFSSGGRPREILGPMQLLNTNANTVPTVLGSRTIMTGGVATTVTSPVVSEYSWPSSTRSFARVLSPSSCGSSSIPNSSASW